MKFVILDNTGWTMHFVALQSISRHLSCIRRVSPSSGTSRASDGFSVVVAPFLPFAPFFIDVRADVCDDTSRPPLQIFRIVRRYP
jgi:hypothetical protein